MKSTLTFIAGLLLVLFSPAFSFNAEISAQTAETLPPQIGVPSDLPRDDEVPSGIKDELPVDCTDGCGGAASVSEKSSPIQNIVVVIGVLIILHVVFSFAALTFAIRYKAENLWKSFVPLLNIIYLLKLINPRKENK